MTRHDFDNVKFSCQNIKLTLAILDFCGSRRLRIGLKIRPTAGETTVLAGQIGRTDHLLRFVGDLGQARPARTYALADRHGIVRGAELGKYAIAVFRSSRLDLQRDLDLVHVQAGSGALVHHVENVRIGRGKLGADRVQPPDGTAVVVLVVRAQQLLRQPGQVGGIEGQGLDRALAAVGGRSRARGVLSHGSVTSRRT